MAEYWTRGVGDIEIKKVTPVLRALLPLLCCDATADMLKAPRIAYESAQGYPFFWDDEDLLERLTTAAEAHGLDIDTVPWNEPAHVASSALLDRIYRKICADRAEAPDPAVLAEIGVVRDGGDVESLTVDRVAQWLRWLDDGHGFKALCVSESYGCDKLIGIDDFGGAVYVSTPGVEYARGTNVLLHAALNMSRALEKGDQELAAQCVSDLARGLAGSIRDRCLAAEVLERSAALLLGQAARWREEAQEAQDDPLALDRPGG